VARQYVQSSDYQNDVDQLIFLGTPHRGAPMAYLRWEGAELGKDTIDKLTKQLFVIEARKYGYDNLYDYIHNRPISSVQELLPTFNYITEKNTGKIRSYPENYPRNLFLEKLNKDDFHALLNTKIRITNIAGSLENSTLEKVMVSTSTIIGLWENGQPDGFYEKNGNQGLVFGDGDGTVTISSSKLSSAGLNNVVTSKHGRLPTEQANLVYKTLSNRDSVTNIDTGFNINMRVLILQLLSPIDVVIVAPDGKKIGKNFSDGSEYNEIPRAFYSGYDTDNEYITILNPADGEYKVELIGTDNGGEYGVVTSLISDATSTTNQIQGITKPNQITDVSVNLRQDRITKSERMVTLEVLKNDITGAYDIGWIKDKKTRDSLIKQVESAIKLQNRIETIYERLPNGQKKERQRGNGKNIRTKHRL
jgi:hypothetical protein